jgi:hypothetical protein
MPNFSLGVEIVGQRLNPSPAAPSEIDSEPAKIGHDRQV